MQWTEVWQGWLSYYLIWNVFAFLMVGWDKHRARRGKWRIRERTFLGLAFLLGAAGTFAGMYFFRHKTQHTKFVVGMPLMLILNGLMGYFLWVR